MIVDSFLETAFNKGRCEGKRLAGRRFTHSDGILQRRAVILGGSWGWIERSYRFFTEDRSKTSVEPEGAGSGTSWI